MTAQRMKLFTQIRKLEETQLELERIIRSSKTTARQKTGARTRLPGIKAELSVKRKAMRQADAAERKRKGQ